MEGGMIQDPETGEMIPADGGMGEDPSQNAGGGLLSSPFLWIGLAIIVALVVVLLRKRSKDKKEKELIIEDEDI